MHNDAPLPPSETVDVLGHSLSRRRCTQIALGLLFLLTLGMFADVLFTAQEVILSDRGADVFASFAHTRAFGFGELRQGNLALWNPHNAGGEPFFAMFQTGLLYPLNFPYLLLPLAKAINAGIALHIFLAGVFMYGWTNQRGLHPLACFFCAVLWMFCGAHWPHVSAGHLTALCSLIWAPLVFLAIDGSLQRPRLKWFLLGASAVAMQIFAGHPQYVFYTGLAAGIYAALRLSKTPERFKIAPWLTGFYVAGLALAAVQLLPGLDVSREIIRSTGLRVAEAGNYSFPPENFLTLLAPNFFNRVAMVDYWGRWFAWETMAYFGVSGLLLAIFGAVAGNKTQRAFSVTMALLFIVLALGTYTPLFALLHGAIPVFDKFRGTAKFIFVTVMFLIMLAGIGLDKLLQDRRAPRWLGLASLILAVVLAGGGAVLFLWGTNPPASLWASVLLWFRDSQQSFLPAATYAAPDFIAASARTAARSLFWAALVAGGCAVLFRLATKSPRWIFGVVLLGLSELLIFAAAWRDTFRREDMDVPPLQQLLAQHPGDYRILNLLNSGMAIGLGAYDVWGDDPAIMRRYAEFLAFTQDMPPDEATQALRFTKTSPLFRLLRCRFVIVPKGGKKLETQELSDPLPRFLLVNQARVLARRDDIFAALSEPSFDPAQTVILERPPQPEPAPASTPGRIQQLDASTDHVTLQVQTPSAALLLVTDAFSKNWRVTGTGGLQSNYEIMPANYCLSAIPLAAGEHHLRLEYRPMAFVVGKWISLGTLALALGLLAWWRKTARPQKS